MDASKVDGMTRSPSEAGAPIQGYSRAEVDEFLAAAAVERERLEREISDAHGRIARARAALGMHRVMVAMMLETQRELGELRQNAERRAAEIVAEAHRAGATFPPSSAAIVESEPAPSPSTIDLDAVDRADAWASIVGSGSAIGAESPSNDEYFDFLRGALADDSPLGPVAE